MKPPSLALRVRCIEAFLRDDNLRKTLGEEATPSAAMYLSPGMGAATPNGLAPQTKPTIKPRIEALIARAHNINMRLDQFSHTIMGDGAPASAQEVAAPFTVPDQLEMLETLLDRAMERLMGLSERF